MNNDRMHRQKEVTHTIMTNPSTIIPKISASLVATRAMETKITDNNKPLSMNNYLLKVNNISLTLGTRVQL